jgi:lantibiotic biosynthesis protein
MTASDRASFLSVAESAAAEIMAEAVWHEDRCSWIGAVPEEAPNGRVTLTFRALGADMYDGTAGVGLFLAELAGITGDSRCRRTALGALRHAISHTEDVAPTARLGLYAGRAGIAVALALAACSLEQPQLETAANAIADTIARPDPADELDLMSGSAGTITGLLALRLLLDNDRLLEAAAGHGEALLARGQRTSSGMCWPSPSLPAQPGLTGFSHGAAGIGVTLLELAAATGMQSYRDAAHAAFAYERALYDPAVGNWPDLRSSRYRAPDEKPGFATFWCHGAPGGALARLRALELGADRQLQEEAWGALMTTEAWVAAAITSGAVNYSLCHGLAGNAEILLEGNTLVPSASQRAYQVAMAGIDAYHAHRQPWPSGARGGATPGLFLGLAGIGRFYLRLAQPRLPSLLLVRPPFSPAVPCKARDGVV